MTELLVHTDFNRGYRLKYPGDWERLSLGPALTGFFAPRESPTDIFRENVNVGIEEIAVSLAEHVDRQVKLMTSFGGNLQISDRRLTELAGLPAERLEFRGKVGPVVKSDGNAIFVPMNCLQIYVLKSPRLYCITYSAEERAYEKFMPQIGIVLSSLELS